MTTDPAAARQLPAINRLIHEPARYNVMALLYVVERADFLFVQNQTGLTPGNLSSHVSKLEAAEYIEVKKTFVRKTPKTSLRLTPTGRAAFDAYRAKMSVVFSPGSEEEDAKTSEAEQSKQSE